MVAKKVLFYILLIGLIVAGSYASKNSFLLKTHHAPHGILSLELCYSNNTQAILLTEWKKASFYEVKYDADSGFTRKKICGLSAAASDTHADFVFIVFYVGLLSFLIYKNRSYYANAGFLHFGTAIILVIIAGCMDITENIFELRSIDLAMQHDPITSTGLALFVSIPSTIKWVLLTFSIIYYYVRALKPRQATFLKRLNILMAQIAKQLWSFRIVIIGLFVLYAIFNLADQGKDLLVAINSSAWGVFWFILVIFVLAVLNWYLPKTYDQDPSPKVKKNILKAPAFNYDRFNIKKYMSRVIGSATLLVPATGLVATMQSYHIRSVGNVPPVLIFIVLIVVYIELLRHKVLDKIYNNAAGKFIEGRYWISLVVCLAIIIIFGIRSTGSNPANIIFLALDFFVLSFLFLVTVNYRTQFKNNFPFVPVLLTASSLVFLLFLLFNIRSVSAFFTKEDQFYSLPVFIAGIVFYTLLASLLLLAGRRYNIRFITLLLLVTISISLTTITDFHKVSLVAITTRKDVKEQTLRNYVVKWLESRRNEISAQRALNKKYPVYFVNAYGGGIKAAAWTAIVVGRLNKRMQQDKGKTAAVPDFEHYVFSYSGASGGTIGLSLLAGARITHANDPLNDTLFSSDTGRKVFEHDYLTNDLVGVLGRDAWMGSFGLNCYADRAKVSEQAWEDYTRKFGISYDTPLRLGWANEKMEVPLFVSDTYDIDRGIKGILAPVKLSPSDFPAVTMIQNLIDTGYDIHLSTAAFLSARFPYVSPTGKFDNKHHFTDGGTIENAGAETALQLIRVFNSVVDSLENDTLGKKDNTVFKAIQVCILSIPNSVPAMDSVEREKNVYELGAPIAGILNSIDGNEVKADSTNQVTAKLNDWEYYKMVPEDAKIEGGTIHPILPLGWQISKYALDMMDTTVRRRNSPLDTIMKDFESDFKKPPK